MGILYKTWKMSIFKRLIISFICILLPVYILNIIIYNWSIATLNNELSRTMIYQVSFYLNGLEKDIERMQILLYSFLNDDNLNKLAAIPQTLNNIEKVQSILSLQQQLNAVKNSSIYIDDIYAIIPAIDKKILVSTISEFDRQEYQQLRDISFSSRIHFTYSDEKILLGARYHFLNSKTDKKDPIFIVIIELSKQKIKEALSSMVNKRGEGVIFFNLDQNYMISTEPDSIFEHGYGELVSVNPDKNNKNAKSIMINGKRYLLVYTVSDYLNSVLYKYVPESHVFEPLRKYQIWFVLFIAIAFAIIIVYSFNVYRFIHKPLNKLSKAFKQVENGNFNISVIHNYDDEFQYIYNKFNAMVNNLKTLIDQVYKQKILMQKMELKQLQAQINPHFLYNSFFILNTIAKVGEYDTLEQFTEQLGEYFRFITRSAPDEVPLLTEVKHARVYTEIQAMRFSSRIQVCFDEIPANYSNVIVPRLILQPVIENAFVHGLEKKVSDGILLVKFITHENGLDIAVEDNGEGMDDKTLRDLQIKLSSIDDNMEITGIINIHRRLKLKFGEQSGLQIERSNLGGLKIIIVLRF